MKRLLLCVTIFALGLNQISSQTISIPKGSVIIDMGVVPQTIENGLKPYGLVYSLITNYSTPVIWSINPSKTKDGADFILDNKTFKGGTFIISKQFLTDQVLSEITQWESEGVNTYTALSNIQVPLYRELKFFPNWVLDTNNGGIAEQYMENAGIPVELASREALPVELTTCDDLFILPHADPNWEEHGNALLDWNAPFGSGPTNANGGYIWSGCHAVSALENLYNPNNPSEQTNFLSKKSEVAIDNGDDYYENALILWGEHENASEISPYQIDFPTDPFMQFIGSTDGAHAGGSEQVYLPVLNGGWRSSTNISIWDANHEDLGSLSNGKAAIMAFGYAFGDSDRGQVMYQGGHQLTNGTDKENVAAQRAFLNFSFEAAKAKVPSLEVNASVAEIVEGGDNIFFDVSASTSNGSAITYEWSSSNPLGTFNDNTSATPVFSTNSVSSEELCVITVKVSDACGRITFNSWGFTIVPAPTAPDVNNDSFATYNTNTISFNALANDTDLNNNLNPSSFEVLSPLEVTGGTFVNNGNGNIAFNPDPNFSGAVSLDYQICDDTSDADGGPFCETASITIHVVGSSCSASQTISNETSYAFDILSSNKWKNEDKSLGAPDFNYSKSDDSEEGYVVYDLGDMVYVGSTITVRYTTDSGELLNGVIDIASTPNGFPNNPTNVSTMLESPNYEYFFIPAQQYGLRYVKITGDKNFAIESIQFEKEVCIDPSPVLVEPTVNTLTTEDTLPTITGTWGGNLGGDDSLSVYLAGTSYSENNGLIINGTSWNLSVASSLNYGVYNVMATVIRNSTNEMIIDSSRNELFVVPSDNYQQSQPVSSGNDGGLESNGNLASLIAKRNFIRKKTQNATNKKSIQTPFIKAVNIFERNEGASSLEDYLPETGVNGDEIAHVSSPEDLLQITNAEQIFSVDYYSGDNRIAAVLATKTNGSIYDHSKIICDRLNSSVLEDAWAFSMQGHQIISTRLLRANGEIEYTLSFSVKLGEDINEVFSFWNIEQYPQGDFYNFQIWGSSYTQIFSICNDILETLASDKPLISTNVENVIPDVFVQSGYYAEGAIHLNIANKVGALSMTVEGNISETEVSERYHISQEIELNGEWNQTVTIETGNLFDIGLSLTGSGSSQNDALYLADGPWGVDFLQEYASVEVFQVDNVAVEQIEDVHIVERQPTISGMVKGNVNVFRHLLPGDQTLNVSDFTSISFTVKNDHPLEVILMNEELTDWNNRLRYTIPVNTVATEYTIAFSEFLDASGTSQSLNDVKTVVFSVIGNYRKYIPYSIEIHTMSFRNIDSLSIEETMVNEMTLNNYPNPFKSLTTINLPEVTNYAYIQVIDVLGRIIDQQRLNTESNGRQAKYQSDKLSTGVYKYIIKLDSNKNYLGTFLID